jgi:hypothetical protein
MILAREQFPAVLVDLMGQPSSSPSLIITILETLRRLCLTGTLSLAFLYVFFLVY